MRRQEVKEKLKECLRQFDGVDSKDDIVSETMFNIYGREMNAIVRMFSGEIFLENQDGKSNAQLIATAPELLECLMDLENDNGSIPKPIWDKIQKTIDKALGL